MADYATTIFIKLSNPSILGGTVLQRAPAFVEAHMRQTKTVFGPDMIFARRTTTVGTADLEVGMISERRAN
jgi:hypothetical protein